MKLYFSPASCSLSIHIVLYELGGQFATEKVDLKTKQTASGKDFLKINPKGYVPALELDNGEILSEAAVILQYLADQNSSAKLFPATGGIERYRAQEWLNFISTEIHKGLGALWNPKLPADARPVLLEKLSVRLDYLNNHLATNEYVLGRNYSVADAYLFTVMNWTNFLKVDISKWSHIQNLLERLKTRTAVQRALQAEGLLKAA